MKKQWPIDLNKIEIKDDVWSHYTSLVDEVALPYQYKMLCEGDIASPNQHQMLCENDAGSDKGCDGGEEQGKNASQTRSSCIDNFKIAAGEMSGEHSGVVFLDTDLYKWLETVAYCLQRGKGKSFERKADEAIELIGRAQQPDGYVNTFYTITAPQKRWSNLVEGHELYCAGHLIEAAVAYYTATSKNAFLNIAIRFADLICHTFGRAPGQIKGYPGHQIIELALFRLYEVTKEQKYLDEAKYFIDERGSKPSYFLEELKRNGGYEFFTEFSDYDLKYSQAHLPVREQRDAEGHAVRCMYMCSAMADIASESSDDGLLHACRELFKSATEKRMYITGAIGSSGILERFTADYDLPNAEAYCETCASIGLAMFARRMTELTGDAKYYDAAERALFNRVLSGISADGGSYFYVDPLEVWPDACMPNTSMAHVKPKRQKWFLVACCPPNVARTLASLGNYIYSQNHDTFFINSYISSSFSATAANAAVRTELDADVARGKTITVRCTADKAGAKIAARIPSYANVPSFKLNGKRIKPEIRDGYAVFELCKGESIITIDFHIKPVFVAADSRVRADAGKAALVCGPAVYCLEQTDNGDNLSEIVVNADEKTEFSEMTLRKMKIPTLSYTAQRVTRKGEGLYEKAKFKSKKVRLTAVPYAVWANREAGEMSVWQRLK